MHGAITPTYVLASLQGYMLDMLLIGSPKVSAWKVQELDRLCLLNCTGNVYYGSTTLAPITRVAHHVTWWARACRCRQVMADPIWTTQSMNIARLRHCNPGNRPSPI